MIDEFSRKEALKHKLCLEDLLASDMRIIEVGARDIELARFMVEKTGNRYLGLVERHILESAKDNQGDLIGRLYPYVGPEQISQNNADVLILSGALVRHIWSFHSYNHAKYLVWAPEFSVDSLSAARSILRHLVAKGVRFVSFDKVKLAAEYRTYCTLEILRRKPESTRCFVSPAGMEQVFTELKRREVNYVIMRWFEGLPDKVGRDIDLLVADEDVDVFRQVANRLPGHVKCGLYSVSGLPGTDFRGKMSYYPPPLAKQILTRARWWKGIYRVPSEEDYFLSLAYHAVYQKGEESALPSDKAGLKPSRNAKHDYATIFRSMAESLGLDVEISMEGLDKYLHARGWRPMLDTLARLAKRNEWLRQQLLVELESHGRADNGLVVFFIRRRALELGFEQEIIELLASQGFSILAEKVLDEQASKQVENKVRGGNWGKNSFPQSGGGPAMVVVGVDLIPLAPGKEVRDRYRALENERIIRAKEKVRALLNERLPSSEQCNMIHSSDNGIEALAYLRAALPDEAGSILREVERLAQAFVTDLPVIKSLTGSGRRAKFELVEYEGRLAVKKTFRPGAERFLAQEHFIMEHLSKLRPEVPPLLDFGHNFIIYPYYNDTLGPAKASSQLFPLQVIKQSVDALRFFQGLGYTVTGFTPGNIIFDEEAGLKIVDFDFLEEGSVTDAVANGAVGGFPVPSGEVPRDLILNYQTTWQPHAGLSLEALLHQPVWLQQLMRWQYSSFKLALPRLVRRRLRFG